MGDKEIMYILENVDIDENEFSSIDVELNDVEKKRIKKKYRQAIIKRGTKVKKICIACALVVIIGAIPAISSPVMASNIPILSTIYETLGIYDEYKDYTTYIGQSIKVSKYTYTLDNMMVTPYKSLMAVKITSSEPIPRDHDDFILTPIINGIHCTSGSSQMYWIDDNNLIVTFEHEFENKVPKKSTVKIDIETFDKRDIDSHGTFEFKADFDKSYKEFISIPIKSNNKDNLDLKFKELNSSIMDTEIISENYDSDKLELLLNIDGDFYGGLKATTASRSITRFEQIDPNIIKNAKTITLYVYRKKYSNDECNDRRELSDKTIEQPKLVEEKNVTFPPYYNFLDGHKGKLYNLERENNTVKIHYKGNPGDIVSLSQMGAWNEGMNKWDKAIKKSIFSKVTINANDENDFTIEFTDDPNAKKVNLRFTDMFSTVNEYTLLDTIKIK